jgi:hypothetical protein
VQLRPQLLAPLLMLLVGAAPAGPAWPSFRILFSQGVVPCALHVDATQFPLTAGTPLTARYDWDFGDAGSRYDRLSGFVAAHLYQRPGRYRISLAVTDQAGVTQSAFATVVLTPSDRRDFFVSPDGDDLAPGNSPEAPLRTAEAALKHIHGDEASVLFQAGRVHPVSGALQIDRRNIRFGRYGPGANPVLVHPHGNGNCIIALGRHCDGILIEHLTFDTPYPADLHGPANKVGIDAIDAGGRNVVVNDCTFLNVDDGVNANGSPAGLLVQNCAAPLVNGLRAYCVWGQGSDHAYLGNFVANSTREHCIRMFSLTRVLIADNNLTNLDRTKDGDPHDAGYYKGCIECQRGSYFYVTQNRVSDGQIRVGPLGVGEPPGTATDWAVIDSNTVNQCHVIAYSGAHHVMIRNNLIYNDNNEAISIAGQDLAGERICSDISVLNNTAVNNGTHGAFLRLGGVADGILMMNNLLVAPQWRGDHGSAVSVADHDLNSFAGIGHNIWPDFGGDHSHVCTLDAKPARNVDASEWEREPVVKQDSFADVSVDSDGVPTGGIASAGAAVLNTATPMPGVWNDRAGNPRPATEISVGAFQLKAGGASISNPTSAP